MRSKRNPAGMTETAVSICTYLLIASSLIFAINHKTIHMRDVYLTSRIGEEMDFLDLLQTSFPYVDPFSGNQYPIIDLSKIRWNNIAMYTKNFTIVVSQNGNSSFFNELYFPVILYNNATLSEGLLEID